MPLASGNICLNTRATLSLIIAINLPWEKGSAPPPLWGGNGSVDPSRIPSTCLHSNPVSKAGKLFVTDVKKDAHRDPKSRRLVLSVPVNEPRRTKARPSRILIPKSLSQSQASSCAQLLSSAKVCPLTSARELACDAFVSPNLSRDLHYIRLQQPHAQKQKQKQSVCSSYFWSSHATSEASAIYICIYIYIYIYVYIHIQAFNVAWLL